ncbi:MAG: kinase [Clostridiales bacterium]|nr:kinase [Clostridiales bacterium]
MAKVGIIVNLTKDRDLKVTSSITKWLEENACQVILSEITADQLERPELGYSLTEMYKQCDFVIVLGGDGTLLGAARQILWLQTPILGINMGHLGFITEVETNDIYTSLEKILKGQYKIEERMMLEAVIIKQEKKVETFYCLNDVGITRGTISRMVKLKTFIDDSYIDTYFGDGLLISTPTGSTAYSLSSGGPIISPGVKVILLTPICPHSLNSRSLVVSDEDRIKVEIIDNYQEVFLTIDGQQGYKLRNGDRVIIKKAPFSAKLIKVSNRNFYDVLRTKLRDRDN